MTTNREALSDRSGSGWLVHPLLQIARGYLTDEDYVAVEATLQEAVERAKDMEAENERLRGDLKWIYDYAYGSSGVTGDDAGHLTAVGMRAKSALQTDEQEATG